MAAKNLFSEAHGVFLDPLSCGSSVRYSVETVDYVDKSGDINRSTFDAGVSLSDCSRVITWSGHGKEGGEIMLRKLQSAIAELYAAKRAIRAGMKLLKVDTDE